MTFTYTHPDKYHVLDALAELEAFSPRPGEPLKTAIEKIKEFITINNITDDRT